MLALGLPFSYTEVVLVQAILGLLVVACGVHELLGSCNGCCYGTLLGVE